MDKNLKIGVIGLGYVGFPLACLFAQKYPVIGFDVKKKRVDELNNAIDSTFEVSTQVIASALEKGLYCTDDKDELLSCNVYIVAVPTPVDERHNPELSPLKNACRLLGEVISKGNVVIFESTVYPGTTEEFCAPIIEQLSGLKLNEGFFLGYSPERINPGDKEHTVDKILKITSGSTPEIADFVDKLYNSVLKNGTHRAPTIKVAEAAKILENTQRDVNIALMNEITMIFNALQIDTQDVLAAAGTKWNFLHFSPGLVGGHCISVDPYYLIDKAMQKGVVPRIIIESRRVNDAMGSYVANQVIQCMNRKGLTVYNARILLLGFTFKENCPDIRNTKVSDIYRSLRVYTPFIRIYDPWVKADDTVREYNLVVDTELEAVAGTAYDAIVLCVNHTCFQNIPVEKLLKPEGILYDVKGKFNSPLVTERM